MQNNFTTTRLALHAMQPADTAFIFELLNTPGWLQFIGNRNIDTAEAAEAYIQRILANSNVQYWIVKLKHESVSIGVITFIQRDYLAHPDIGFAFLPQYAKQGYACEAAMVILNYAKQNLGHTQILATTLKANENSIHLLLKLGFAFYKEIEVGTEKLQVYAC